MKNNYLLIEISGEYPNFFLKKCLNNKIYLKEINYLNNDLITVKCLKDDYSKILNLSKDYQIKKISDLGINFVINNVKQNSLIYLSLILIICFMYLFTNFIVEIKVIHSNSDLRRLIYFELENNGVKNLSFKKNYNTLQKIKNQIINTHKDKIEWLEIISKGMSYEIRIEERKLNPAAKDDNKCHIVAKKAAIIKEIVHSNGEVILENNDYVNKGDILISGDIIYNNEVTSSVCAEGTVYGEVWYMATVSLPLDYQEQIKTGKIWYNFQYKNNKIFKSKYKNYLSEEKKLFKLFDDNLYLIKEHQITIKPHRYQEKEAYEIAVNKVIASIETKLKEKEAIISQNVLKKELNDSTITLEVFVAVKEIISTSLVYQ